tara:strand:- start:889 stop:1134 length:246 start_codon:yes stop_codon:yes gene_type:complete
MGVFLMGILNWYSDFYYANEFWFLLVLGILLGILFAQRWQAKVKIFVAVSWARRLYLDKVTIWKLRRRYNEFKKQKNNRVL